MLGISGGGGVGSILGFYSTHINLDDSVLVHVQSVVFWSIPISMDV